MTPKSKRQLEYTVSTHMIERQTPSQNALHLCEQVSDGKISADAAVEALLRLYGLKRVSAAGE